VVLQSLVLGAATKICLIEDRPGVPFGEVRTAVDYSLCGRTDKGVSGLGNVTTTRRPPVVNDMLWVDR